jgi:flagellin
MRGQIGGLAQAQRNAQDGISMVQTAEGALTEVHSMLQRVRDLKVQYNNGTNSADDKVAIASEVSQIAQEVSDIVSDTKFNGTAVFNNGTFSFQVGANDSETVSTSAANLSGDVASGGLSGLTNITDAAGASTAFETGGNLANLSAIDDAIKNVSKIRADFGAVQNRLEHRLNNLATYQENLTASESRIRDVDMAAEMTKFTKLNILQQAGTSMLAQANQAPQGVLSLLR